jgi:hypothetical protein
MNYIVYDKKTGDILRAGSCPPEMVEMQATNDNEAVIEGTANDALDLVEVDTKEIRREGKQTRREYELLRERRRDHVAGY